MKTQVNSLNISSFSKVLSPKAIPEATRALLFHYFMTTASVKTM